MVTFDLHRMLLGEFPVTFLLEVAVRVLAAFLAVFCFLKFSGRRGIKQLSRFELVVILTLGSAAGDVTFYEDVPLLPVALVFITLLVLYRGTIYLMKRSKTCEAWIDGLPITVVKDGMYEVHSLRNLNISASELFMELRQQGVEHLGKSVWACWRPMATSACISTLPRIPARLVRAACRTPARIQLAARGRAIQLRRLRLCDLP